MNQTKILFLKMLRGDIKRNACEKMGIDISQVSKDKEELLTGQTIKRSDIESFSSYKMMTDEERAIVNSILETSKRNESANDSEKGKALLKHIESLVPTSQPDAIEYKDAA